MGVRRRKRCVTRMRFAGTSGPGVSAAASLRAVGDCDVTLR